MKRSPYNPCTHPPAAAQTPGDHQAAALLEGGGRAPDPLQPPQLLGLHLVADTAETVFTILSGATTGTVP